MQPVFCSQAHEGPNPGMWFYPGVAQQSREVPVTCYPMPVPSGVRVRGVRGLTPSYLWPAIAMHLRLLSPSSR